MNKIINIRGTSGAGKSHLARRVMANYPVRKPVHVAGRKQPLYYEYEAPDHGVPLFVVGHYECACGGTDTISSGTDGIYELIRELAPKGNVFFEGLLIGSEVTRTAKLPEVGETHVIFLTTPVEQCVESVNERRRARGQMEPVNPANTISKHKNVAGTLRRMAKEAPRVIVHTLDREAAYNKVMELLS